MLFRELKFNVIPWLLCRNYIRNSQPISVSFLSFPHFFQLKYYLLLCHPRFLRQGLTYSSRPKDNALSSNELVCFFNMTKTNVSSNIGIVVCLLSYILNKLEAAQKQL
jgi:hypothetical protein